jgi:hypothetical protein
MGRPASSSEAVGRQGLLPIRPASTCASQPLRNARSPAGSKGAAYFIGRVFGWGGGGKAIARSLAKEGETDAAHPRGCASAAPGARVEGARGCRKVIWRAGNISLAAALPWQTLQCSLVFRVPTLGEITITSSTLPHRWRRRDHPVFNPSKEGVSRDAEARARLLHCIKAILTNSNRHDNHSNMSMSRATRLG